MLRTLFSLASPAGPRARLSILIFHRVLATPDPLFPDEACAERFDAVCQWLARWFQVLPLDEALQRLDRGHLPARAAAITFDDGYADNHDVAAPILKSHGLTATFFIATGFLDGGRMWNDTVIEAIRGTTGKELAISHLLPDDADATVQHRPVDVGTSAQKRALIDDLLPRIKYLPASQREQVVAGIAVEAAAAMPSNLMMTSAQVKALRSMGMGIGVHTVTHPILARVTADVARQEIADSRDTLAALLGERITFFAYPNGKPNQDYSRANVDTVRALGFDAAVSTAWGAAGAGADRFQLPRFTPWDRAPLPFALRMARNLRAPVSVVT